MKLKNIVLITSIILGFILFNLVSTNASEPEVIVGLDVNVPPMGFVNSAGDIVGFDIDLANRVFKRVNKKVKFQPIDWDSKELELSSGNIDVIWNGLSKTEQREMSMLLTKPYMKNRQVVIVEKDSDINSINDLKNKNVCVQKGSTGSNAIKKHDIYNQLKNITELESMVNCLNEVGLGLSDATVVDETVSKYYLLKENLNGKFRILEQEISLEYYVVAVKKGNEELKAQIEKGLEDLNSSKEAEEISKKWFSDDLFFWQEVNESNTNTKDEGLEQIPFLAQGALNTLSLFFVVLLASLPIGFLVCIINKFKNRLIKFLINSYINLMRGTPLLLQLFFIFYGLPYIPLIGSYISFKDRFIAGAVAFILNYSAYFAEIFRGGFLSIDKGQIEATKVLGFSKSQTLFKILIPQVLRVTLPSICNETITLIKDTSLIYAIGIQELLATAKSIVNSTTNISAYAIAAGIYLLLCYIIIKTFRKIERKVSF